ncbi:hypothetical protein N2152v2_003585 [Parachlorella kessleri]
MPIGPDGLEDTKTAPDHVTASGPLGKGASAGPAVAQLVVNATSTALRPSPSRALDDELIEFGVATEGACAQAPAPSTTGQIPAEHGSGGALSGMQDMTSDDDFTHLFDFDDFLSLDALPSEFLHGDDGSELLTGAFADLLSPEPPESTARAPPGQHFVSTAGPSQRDLHQIASKARSLLESLGGGDEKADQGTAGAGQRPALASAGGPERTPVAANQAARPAQPPAIPTPPPSANPLRQQYQGQTHHHHQQHPHHHGHQQQQHQLQQHQHESLVDLLNSPMKTEPAAGQGQLAAVPPLAPAGPPVPTPVHYQMVPSGPVYLDGRTGQVLLPPPMMAGTQQPYQAWPSHPLQGQVVYSSTGQPYLQVVTPEQQHAQQAHQQAVPMVMQYAQSVPQAAPPAVPGMAAQHAAGTSGAQDVPRRAPAKRKSQQHPTVSPEMAMDRSVRLAQGYSYEHATGRLLRHGPALAAAAMHDKDVPAVTALFAAYAQQPFSSGAPPAGYGSQVVPLVRAVPAPQHYAGPGEGAQSAPAYSSHPQQLPAVVHGGMVVHGAVTAAHANPRDGLQHSLTHAQKLFLDPQTARVGDQLVQGMPAAAGYGEAAAAAAAPAAGQQYTQQAAQHSAAQQRSAEQAGQSWSCPSPSQTSSVAPSGRHIQPETGHGFIKSLVVRELQSAGSQPAAMPRPATSKGGEGALKGVARDSWSLFWDAYVQPSSPVASTSLLPGFKQEAVYLGKFPTKEMAGRAHDLAALKLNGPAAETNYPMTSYQRVLPTLQAHSSEALVAAIRKDSQLAVRRTSKFKGVRRVGQGHFEARIDSSGGASQLPVPYPGGQAAPPQG